jgi:hypothetical protein
VEPGDNEDVSEFITRRTPLEVSSRDCRIADLLVMKEQTMPLTLQVPGSTDINSKLSTQAHGIYSSCLFAFLCVETDNQHEIALS